MIRPNAVFYHWRIAAGLIAFAAAYGQAPLFYSNQNQYLLHGYAAAGAGTLAEDWLARTADPTPIFSGIVALIVRWTDPSLLHAVQTLLLAIYAGALVSIFGSIADEGRRSRWPIFLAGAAIVHSAAARWLSYRLFGQDFPWYFQAGVAGQYILGAMLQPSVFGVLLMASIALFLRSRPIAASFAIALAATLHSTYLLPGALLTCGYLACLVRERRFREAFATATFTLAGVVPVTLFVYLRFAPTSTETFATARDILVNVRIPHHCRVDLWLDPVAGGQIAWVGVALLSTWRSRLFLVMAVPFAFAGLLTIVQVATGSATLALLFPWRISTILVPLATAIALARLAAALPEAIGARIGAVVLALLAVAGLVVSFGRLAYRTSDDELPLYEFVRGHRASGNVYLIPTRVPDLVAQTRGSFSSDFKPLAEKSTDPRIVPLDLQRFRLMTGTPIHVDFKAIPYKDGDVVEWRHRLDDARDLHATLGWAGIARHMRERGITHVVVPAIREVASPGLRRVHRDAAYQVFAVE